MSHPTGTSSARHNIGALERAGRLAAFYTAIAVPGGAARHRACPARLGQELARRTFDVPRSRIVTSPLKEIVRLVASRTGVHVLSRHEVGWASVDAVYHGLDRRLARDLEAGRVEAATVYAYEDGALESLETARGLGLHAVYHLPSAYWRLRSRLLEEERERRPEWASTMVGLADSPAKHRRKDQELGAADCVIVNSSFARRSLEHCPRPPRRIEVIPYGAPPPVDRPRVPDRERGRRLRVLFVGNLGQLKGLADLHEAVERVRGLAALTLVGARTTGDCPALDHVIEAHRWLPPVPHARALDLMAAHDVLALPSLAEGFGLVISEALARGLPVVTTPHTGGADLMTDGRDGFIVPIRDPDAIADRLGRLARDRDLLAAMSAAALETARRNPWRRYEARIVEICTEARQTRGSTGTQDHAGVERAGRECP